MNSPAIEATKEVLRLVVFAAMSAAVGWAITKLGSWDPSNVYVIVGIPVLRAVDKWVHVNQDVNAKGILPF